MECPAHRLHADEEMARAFEQARSEATLLHYGELIIRPGRGDFRKAASPTCSGTKPNFLRYANGARASPKQQQPRNGIRACPDHGILIEPVAQIAGCALADAEREEAQLPRPIAGRIARPLDDVAA